MQNLQCGTHPTRRTERSIGHGSGGLNDRGKERGSPTESPRVCAISAQGDIRRGGVFAGLADSPETISREHVVGRWESGSQGKEQGAMTTDTWERSEVMA